MPPGCAHTHACTLHNVKQFTTFGALTTHTYTYRRQTIQTENHTLAHTLININGTHICNRARESGVESFTFICGCVEIWHDWCCVWLSSPRYWYVFGIVTNVCDCVWVWGLQYGVVKVCPNKKTETPSRGRARVAEWCWHSMCRVPNIQGYIDYVIDLRSRMTHHRYIRRLTKTYPGENNITII